MSQVTVKLPSTMSNAARNHGDAAQHYETMNHQMAAHHAHTAQRHLVHAAHHAAEVAKSCIENYDKGYFQIGYGTVNPCGKESDCA
jgi:hypothetical protein